jgi:hypothetical protein
VQEDAMGESSLDSLNRLLDLWLPEDEPITADQRAWADQLRDEAARSFSFAFCTRRIADSGSE